MTLYICSLPWYLAHLIIKLKKNLDLRAKLSNSYDHMNVTKENTFCLLKEEC